jgi:hypothetical protein
LKKDQVIDTNGQILTKITYENSCIYYLNAKGELHRTGGPAKIWSDGTQAYYMDNKLHRIDGLAYIGSNGYQAYCVDGIEYIEEQYHKAVLEYKLKQLVG